MLKENKDITTKHLEDTIIFLIRTLHKEVYQDYIRRSFKKTHTVDDFMLYYLHDYLRYIVTLDHKIYVDPHHAQIRLLPDKYFTFIISSNPILLNNKTIKIEIPYEDTLNKLYNDIDGKILDKYIAKQLEEKQNKEYIDE